MSTQIETEKDLEKGAADPIVARCCSEIELYEEAFEQWHERCDVIQKRFRDEDKNGKNVKAGRLNVFFSNCKNIKPNIYAKDPVVQIERRFKDKDPVARVSAEVLERASQYCIDSYPFSREMELAADDFVKFARGQVWLRYKPTVITDEQGQEQLAKEEVLVEFVDRADFGHTPGRTWREVRGVWRWAYLSRKELIDRFGEEIGKAVPLDHTPKTGKSGDKKNKPNSIFKKAKVCEYWDKDARKVYWFSSAYKEQLLDTKDDPLGLEEFFPCPMPAYDTVDTSCLVPLPDYYQYKAIEQELEEVSYRISGLTKALKARGVYNSACAEIKRLEGEAAELDLIAVKNWAQLQQNGGLAKALEWMPIAEIAQVLRYLYEARAQLKADLYEISGMSDIIRGQTDPRETATAQNIKAQFARPRIGEKQKAFSRFVRDIIAIKAEIIAEQFGMDTIAAMAGVRELGQEYMEAYPQAYQLMKEQTLRSYRIDIETDSTIAIDEQAAQEGAVQYMNVLTQALKDAVPIISQVPPLAPILGEAISFVSRQFKIGRKMESILEQSIQQMVQMAMQPPPPPEGQGDPQAQQQAQQQAQVQAQDQQMKMMVEQLRAQNAQQQLQLDQAKLQQDGAIAARKLEQEQYALETKTALESAKLARTTDLKEAEIEAKYQLEAIKTGATLAPVSVAPTVE